MVKIFLYLAPFGAEAVLYQTGNHKPQHLTHRRNVKNIARQSQKRWDARRFDNFSKNHKLDYDHEHVIGSSRCGQKYLLVWDHQEWVAVQKSHSLHSEIAYRPH
jgi:hypothetical protein